MFLETLKPARISVKRQFKTRICLKTGFLMNGPLLHSWQVQLFLRQRRVGSASSKDRTLFTRTDGDSSRTFKMLASCPEEENSWLLTSNSSSSLWMIRSPSFFMVVASQYGPSVRHAARKPYPVAL